MRIFRRAVLLLMSSLLVLVGQMSLIAVASAHASITQTGHEQAAGASACLQPPQNVDLMTLSDAQLQSYGLPPHQFLDQDSQEWSYLLAHDKHRNCGSTPDPRKYTHHPSTGQHSDTAGTGYTSPVWAGNVAYGSRGTYREAVVDFYIPTIAPVVNNSDVFIWAGVGGDGNQTSPVKLVQAGVESYYAPTIGQVNNGWWEVWPDLSEQIFLTGLNRGDHIHVFVSSNVNNDGYDYFYVQDITQNYYNSYKDTSSQHFSDSATGECIVERPQDYNTGQPVPLAEFNPPGHTEQLSSCEIANSTGYYQPIGNWPVYYYTMKNGSKTLAYPGPITNGGLDYPVYWVASS